MVLSLVRTIVGTKNDREIKKIQPAVARINSFEDAMRGLSDTSLQGKTAEFKQRLANGESLDSILPEAFAVVRETGRRVLDMRHFDVQMIGGMVLHQGKIAEMKTGEGKTLVGTLPLYLNALTGKGVHLVTVNDYLAKRDAEWMGKIYNFLGLSVGVISHDLRDPERKKMYACDITYATNNELGFDYLRDNMKFRLEDYVQREQNFCIVDEVDSILIDEARTPLIISGPSDASSDLYYRVNSVIPHLKRDTDFTVDEKARSAMLTDLGVEQVEKHLGVTNLYDASQIALVHHVHAALKAHAIFKIDVDYVVRDGEVVIVDEFTGRLMPGRRWSDGLHQAVEAKEGVTIEAENQTLATITFQNLFRLYGKLAGMTGTADTEAEEFMRIYKLPVVVIPTNRPMKREDHADVIYKTENAKYSAVAQEIKEKHQKGQPVLVGTISIEKSEKLSNYLRKEGIPHSILNAKQHQREAEIVAEAGQLKAVTISTNMAGRGTDIKLGTGVSDAGGLHIIGTERHESRRIDNQLRGRSGRQGDPGSSRFYLSLEDDLMRIFGGERLKTWMDRLGMKDDEAIEHNYITKSIANAQKKVEARNFDIRKHLLEYDDVMNQQRIVIYKRRRELLTNASVRPTVISIIEELVESVALEHHKPKTEISGWDWAGFKEGIQSLFDLSLDTSQLPAAIKSGGPTEDLYKWTLTHVIEKFESKIKEVGAEPYAQIERMLYLQSIDHFWKEHLLAMDHLKEGIGLQGYGQKDPLVEYKKEGFNYFLAMDQLIKNDLVSKLFRVQIAAAPMMESSNNTGLPPGAVMSHPGEAENEADDAGSSLQEAKMRAAEKELRKLEENMRRQQQRMQLNAGGKAEAPAPVRKAEPKVGRNDPCPCGSGQKYKKCHGKDEA